MRKLLPKGSDLVVATMGRLIISGIALAAVATVPAVAVEGGLGRTLPGVWIQPQAGVVGPSPGFSFTTMPIGYMGTIGGGRLVPIGGSIFANVDANINANYGSEQESDGRPISRGFPE